ncbi:hypothetical protein DV738_g132, partial [Chaetothyriales sp. CBS 135597]
MSAPTALWRLTDLPNEILATILTPFLTAELLQVAVVCRRIHSVVARILHFRMVLAPSLPEYKLILEAYHPTNRYFGPHLFCTYLYTDGFSAGADAVPEGLDDVGSFANMSLFYSRFRPERPAVGALVPPRWLANMVQIQWGVGDGGSERMRHSVHLDPEELFGQFCAYSSLVRLGPSRGLFLSTVPIVKPNQGTMRVWKTWLCERAREASRRRTAAAGGPISTGLGAAAQDPNIMWTDARKNVGIKVGVSCRDQICYDESADLDSVPLSFTLEIQVVRHFGTTPLAQWAMQNLLGQHIHAPLLSNDAVATAFARNPCPGMPDLGSNAIPTALTG